MAVARGSDCTDPDVMLGTFPCLQNGCLSQRELLIILAGLFAVGQDLDDLDTLSENSKRFRNLSDLEFLQAMIACLPTAWFTNLSADNIGQDFSCWRCKGDQEIKGIFLYLWCYFWANYAAPN